MKIIADKDIPWIKQLFADRGEVVLTDGRQINPDLISAADLIIVRSVTPVDAALLQGSKVRLVASATSGIDHIDLHFLEEHGIGLVHAPGSNARSVAEYVLSALFVMRDQYGYDLTEKQVGIIGCGQVGSRVLKFLTTLGADCIINDPPLRESTGDRQYCDLAEVMAADIISLHVPLVEDGPYPTRHLVDDDFLRQVKEDVILVNTSRGAVIDESALMNFIKHKPQAHIVLDVWVHEPVINTELLSRADIGTAHIAGYSMDGKTSAVRVIYMQICDYFSLQYDESMLKTLLANEATGIFIREFNSDIEAIQMAVLSCYDVRSDSASLRDIIQVDEQQRAGFFDGLRNDYPVRREFHTMNIKLPSITGVLADKLAALGFHVTTM